MNEQNTANTDGSFNIFDNGSFDLGSDTIEDPFTTSEITAPPTSDVATHSPAQPDQVVQQEQAQLAEATKATTAQPQTVNPLAAAMEAAEKKEAAATADSLFTKPPVFAYAAAEEEITDSTITFEQLRIEKSADFPELDDGKRVSWTMEYGKIVKNVLTPSKTIIGKLKKEIENSKEFLDALIKARDKSPSCKVKPRITAQSKGIAGYKGIFTSIEEAEQSGKAICILPARDGSVYEVRSTEVGRFTTRADNVLELSEVCAGFEPAHPPIPFHQFIKILAFFRYFMQQGQETEVMVHAYWDKVLQEYRIVAPMQQVSKAYISVIAQPYEAIEPERFIHVADIHSHNSMPAHFSAIDDADERATRAYMVIGRLDRAMPEISARISNGGHFLSISPGLLVETMPPGWPAIFPKEWIKAVHIADREQQPSSDHLALQCVNRLKGRFRSLGVRHYEV